MGVISSRYVALWDKLWEVFNIDCSNGDSHACDNVQRAKLLDTGASIENRAILCTKVSGMPKIRILLASMESSAGQRRLAAPTMTTVTLAPG